MTVRLVQQVMKDANIEVECIDSYPAEQCRRLCEATAASGEAMAAMQRALGLLDESTEEKSLSIQAAWRITAVARVQAGSSSPGEIGEE